MGSAVNISEPQLSHLSNGDKNPSLTWMRELNDFKPEQVLSTLHTQWTNVFPVKVIHSKWQISEINILSSCQETKITTSYYLIVAYFGSFLKYFGFVGCSYPQWDHSYISPTTFQIIKLSSMKKWNLHIVLAINMGNSYHFISI